MKKRHYSFLLPFLILFSILLSNEVNAAGTEKQRIFDDANLLTSKEEAKLEKIAQKYSEKRETDFIIITQENTETHIQKYMDDFYDDEGLGFDKEHGNTAILGLDMKKRDVELLGFYKAEKYLSDDRLTQIREKITPDLSDENYFSAFESFITLSSKYMGYRPNVNPENPLYKTSVQLFIAIGIGVLIVAVMAYNVKPKMTTNHSTYRDVNRSKVLQQRDRYIRTTVTKKRKPKQSSGGGGSGGGGSGRTSGGHSRSSSGGKF